jgi:hypothetical protein
MTGREQAEQVGGGLALFLGRGLAADVDLERTPQHQRTRTFVIGARLHQHAADIGVDDDRIGAGIGLALAGDEGAALAAVLGVGNGILVGDLALGEALEADAEAGGVHHDEHGGEALFLLADEIAGGFVVVHHAGGVAVNAHLVLDRTADETVAVAQRTILVHHHLRHDEQRDALHRVRGAGDLGEDEVDDVVGPNHARPTR